MPNGKGTLDCSYCVHFQGKGYPDGCHEERRCRYHNSVLPKPKLPYHNRICCHFEPNEMYWEHNPLREFIPLLRRFAWFGADLEPGVLYEFSYNHPPGITPLAVLRVPDYQNRGWKKPSESA
jgi:hypothetical protein